MRSRYAVIALATFALAACGVVGGDAERQAFITKAVNSCVETAQKGRTPPGVNVEGFCSCAMNKIAEGKTIEQLHALDEQKAPTPADVAIMRQCMTEMTIPAGK